MKRKTAVLGTLLILFAAAAALLFYTGIWQFNHPRQSVRGVDVSHYQGGIDWPVLAEQNVQFAFIKATEGSSFVDGFFDRNWEGARRVGLKTGAYHFFSYDSSGADQAAHFIAHVPRTADMLPPVIDVEFYGGNDKNPPPREQVVPELRIMADALEAHYGCAPILYATEKSYELYISDGFADCDIWIRNVITSPTLSDGRDWTFWQYSNRGRLKGYAGEEPFIDLNVFCGTQAEFDAYASAAAGE